MKFPWDDKVDGLRRGAERFGSEIVNAVTKKMAERRNGFTPKESEPYGVGMGGASTEQSPEMVNACPGGCKEWTEKGKCKICGGSWDAGLKNAKIGKFDFATALERFAKRMGQTVEQIKRDWSDLQLGIKLQDEWEDEQEEKERKNSDKNAPPITCPKCNKPIRSDDNEHNGAELRDHLRMYHDLTDVEVDSVFKGLENEDSSALGYQSAQKTTTAKRSDYMNANPDKVFDMAYDEEFKKSASGIQFNIMDLGNLRTYVKQAVAGGKDLPGAFQEGVAKYRMNSMENSMQSKCPACGHESAERWNGKCGGCGTKNAVDASVGTGRIRLNADSANLDDMMAWEDGSLGEEDTIKLFQRLVDSGMAWQLQGMYGRQAQALIEAGLVKAKERANDDGKKECSRCHGKGGEPGGAEQEPCSACGGNGYMKNAHTHTYEFNDSCGANVCTSCGEHKGLDRCYCGWSRAGGNGRQELEEMGETIDENSKEKRNADSKENTGHLDPVTWQAASSTERYGWLVEANQDTTLVNKEWNELSMDVHQALSNAFDFTRVNSSDKEHALVVDSRDDAKAHCSCGHWSYTSTGEMDDDRVKTNFDLHKGGVKENSIPHFDDADVCDTCGGKFTPGDTVSVRKDGSATCVGCDKKSPSEGATQARFRNDSSDKVGVSTATRDDVVKENANDGARLVYEKTGKEVQVGDVVKDFRGNKSTVTAIPNPPHKRESEGYIELDGVEYYASGSGAKWVGRSDGRENADDKGDVEEIERHVAGIEHELGELKENSSGAGVKRGDAKYGSK